LLALLTVDNIALLYTEMHISRPFAKPYGTVTNVVIDALKNAPLVSYHVTEWPIFPSSY